MNEDDHRHVYLMSEGVLGNVEEFFDFSSDGKAEEIMDSSSDGSNSSGGDNYCDNDTQMSAASRGEKGCGVTPTSEENEINNEANASEKDWVTNFFDPQFNIDIPAHFVLVNDFIDNDESVFGPLSPISVPDEPIIISLNKEGPSSSSISRPGIRCRPTKAIPAWARTATPVGATIMPVPSRARTKRARRPGLVRFTAPVFSSSVEGPPAIPTFLDTIEEPVKTPPVKKMKKKAPGVDDHPDGILPLRKCKHCGISKTPQWRAGPMGPKTLCNACGVRYKSGRLFPEYRPAASPSFVPSLHSNSHKKVVEMRNKAATGAKDCELLACIRGSQLGVGRS